MTEREQYIKELEVFKKLVTLWHQGNHDESVRIQINKLNKKIQILVRKAGTEKRFSIAPPPAIGGMVAHNQNPFDYIFNPPYEMSLIPTINNIIDETIGVIESNENFNMLEDKSDKSKETSSKKEALMEKNDTTLKQIVIGVAIGVISSIIIGGFVIYFTLYKDITTLEVKFDNIPTSSGDSNVNLQNQIDNLSKRVSVLENGENSTEKSNSENIIYYETFDDNIRNWKTENLSKCKKYFANGHLVIESNDRDMYRFSSNFLPNLPSDYDILIKVMWSKGDSGDSFGFKLGNVNDDNYFLFELTQKGYSRILYFTNTFEETIPWKSGYKIPIKEIMNIRLSHRSSGFAFYIDDNLVGQFHDRDVDVNLIGLFALGILTVEFDELKIIGI